VHEWALAEAVLEAVRIEQTRSGRRSARTTIRFGELQGIDQDVFRSGLEQLREQDETLQFELIFQTEPAGFRCAVCEPEWALSECERDDAPREAVHFLPEVVHSFVACPSCGSADFRVVRGRGVTIEGIDFDGNP